MKAFRFTLERLLELRKREEDAIRADLADRDRRLAEASERRTARAVRLATLLDAVRGERGGGASLHPEDLVAADRALVVARAAVADAERTRAIAEGEREACRLALVAAARRRKALELLRDRRAAEWRDRSVRTLARDLEDFASPTAG